MTKTRKGVIRQLSKLSISIFTLAVARVYFDMSITPQNNPCRFTQVYVNIKTIIHPLTIVQRNSFSSSFFCVIYFSVANNPEGLFATEK